MRLSFVANRAAFRSNTIWNRSGAVFAPAVVSGTSSLSSSSAAAAASVSTAFNNRPFQKRGKHTTVALQLDYYMSPQFAGIACALTEGLYESAGIHTITAMATCPVGLEPERVRQFRDASEDTDVVVGSIEQNVLLPTLLKAPDLRVKAVAAMFQQSPLCVVSLNKEGDENNANDTPKKLQRVGGHEDTVELLKRILIYDNYQQDPKHSVVVSPRATKIADLLEGRLDAIQAYTTTELLTLERIIEQATKNKHKPEDLSTILLEGHNGAKLGYSQVLFAPEEDLNGNNDKRAILQAFLAATFEGWAMAMKDPEHGARCVEEAQAMLGLSEEGNDHWDRRQFFEYNVRNTRACCDLVAGKASGESDTDSNDCSTNAEPGYGIIDPKRWDESTQWLLNEPNLPPGFGLDASVWEAGN